MEVEESEETIKKEFLSGFPTIDSYSQSLLVDTFQAVKASNAIESDGTEADIYSTYDGFRKFMRVEGKKILSLMNDTLQHQVGKGSFEGMDIEDIFEKLVDINDGILERAGIALDEASGVRKKEEVLKTVRVTKPINTSWNRKAVQSSPGGSMYQLLAGRNISRPQLNFKDKIDNTNTPFEPIIKYKPNSIKPLSILLEHLNDEEIFSHPYELEVDRFYPTEQQLEVSVSEYPKSLEETPFIFVNTVSDLQSLCDTLKESKEIAVDLEHHSYRTFQGITCLMQISTRMFDYLVDVLLLRSELHVLNEIFTDPKIVKVLHGANMDVQWLQRDFGLYLVNLFDTGQASRVLGFPHLSLSYLMKLYCNFEPDKQIRLADWRMRPLPNEMIRYAREDTHYLLYIYDRIRTELVARGNESKNLLLSVFQRSKEISLIRYRKPYFSENSFLDLYRKSKKNFNPRQLFALKQLYAWRDHLARVEDESIGYVLPNHMMLQIAEVLPREQQGILACCNPIPPFVRQQLNEVHAMILRARESSLSKIDLDEPSKESQPLQSTAADLLEEHLMPVDCPHDLLPNDGVSSYPTLLDGIKPCKSSLDKKLLKQSGLLKPSSGNFANTSTSDTFIAQKLKEVDKLFESFISPYQRLKGVMAKLKDEREAQAALEASQPSVQPEATVDSENQTSMNPVEDEDRIQRIHQHFKDVQSQDVEKAETIEEGASSDEEVISPKKAKQSRKKKRKNKNAPSIFLNASNEANNESVPVQPFDYSSTDKTALQSSQGTAKNKKRQFNPDEPKMTKQAQSKSAKRKKKNQKRFSYTDKTAKMTEQKWPSSK